ncbi:MAG TPA: hypothetical protein VNW15_09605 [Rhizomicrobium sp.]|nr:hypothetical protein [Rhizomicrobium sp.]
MLSLALSAACLFAVFGCAQTETPPPQNAATDAKQAPSEDKQKICVDQNDSTGSRMGSRLVCYTKKEWDALPGKRR